MAVHALAVDRHTALARVIAVTNDKGGVGKTSIVANLADDLGTRGTSVDDQGEGLLAGIVLEGRHPLPVASGVRPNLDLICGGTRLEALTPLMVSKTMVVRHAERTAQDARRLGELAHGLELEAAQQPAWWVRLRNRGEPRAPQLSATAARSVAADYRELAYEVLTVLRSMEQTGAELGTVGEQA